MIKTRTVRRADGRLEILRVLSPDAMDEWSREDPLAYEKSIIWTEDISRLPFVRVKSIHSARSRRGPLQVSGQVRVVGYSKLTPNAPRNADGQTYTRRLFYLKHDDGPGTPPPDGSVDPRSILPGALGASPRPAPTPRSEDAPRSQDAPCSRATSRSREAPPLQPQASQPGPWTGSAEASHLSAGYQPTR